MKQQFTFCLLFLILFSSCRKGIDKKPQALKNVAFVVSGAAKSISVIDLLSHQLVDTYTLTTNIKKFPYQVSLSADASVIAVANPSYDFSEGHNGLHGRTVPGGVVLLEAVTGKSILEFEVPNANKNVILSSDGKEIWTTGMSHSGRAYVYDRANGSLLNEVILDADPTQIFFSRDEKYAVVVSGESTFLQVIDKKTKELVKKIKVDIAPSSVWPGYGDLVLVSNAYKQSINFVDLSSLQVTDYIDLDFIPGFVVYNTLENELWICEDGGDKVYVFKKSASSVWAETAVLSFASAGPTMIQFFANESKALLINQLAGTAVFIDSNSKQVLAELKVGDKPSGIAISE